MSAPIVISSDGHVGCLWRDYRSYLDAEYRDLFDAWIADTEGRKRKLVEQMGPDLVTADAEHGLFNAEQLAGTPQADGVAGAWDPDTRRRTLDDQGIAAEVLFPDGEYQNNSPPFHPASFIPDLDEPELTAAGSRAYNRWLADFCAADPVRFFGLTLLTVHDVDAAVAETRWGAEQGFHGVIIPPYLGDLPGYNDPRYEPLWATCAELGMIVHVHGGGVPKYGTSPGGSQLLVTEAGWFARRAFWTLLWGGVFTRHPDLKLVITESGSGWVPETLHELDFTYEWSRRRGEVAKRVTRPPTEYFLQHCYLGASLLAPREVAKRHEIGIGQILWGSDYPHLEGTWPNTRPAIEELFSGVPESEVRQMLGDNAIALYGVDRARLQEVAERIW